MMTKREHRIAHAISGVLLFGSLALLAVSIVNYHAAAKPTTEAAFLPEPETEYYIVYTEPDKPSELRTRELPLYELTLARYETLARMVAGKAGNCSQTCQQMVANVIYNELMDCGKDLDRAAELYDLYDYADPTEDTYAAVDAIFERGEWMLDEDVLWFGDADNPSDFHKTLVFDCECDGIAFYKAYRPAIVPGGVGE